MPENIGDFRHLNQKCGFSTGEVVSGSDSRENAIHYSDFDTFGWNERTHLCH